jgi:hypothetical protein
MDCNQLLQETATSPSLGQCLGLHRRQHNMAGRTKKVKACQTHRQPGQRPGPMRALVTRRVARKVGRSARQMPLDGASGRKKVSSAQGRMAAPLSGARARGRYQRCLRSVYRWVLIVRPMAQELARQPAASSTTLSGIVLLPTVDAANERSISGDDPLNYNLRFGETSSTRQKNQPIFENSLEYPNCRRCTIGNPRKTQGWSEPTPCIP